MCVLYVKIEIQEERFWNTDGGGGVEMAVEEVVARYGDMLFRICLVMLCNEQDA